MKKNYFLIISLFIGLSIIAKTICTKIQKQFVQKRGYTPLNFLYNIISVYPELWFILALTSTRIEPVKGLSPPWFFSNQSVNSNIELLLDVK